MPETMNNQEGAERFSIPINVTKAGARREPNYIRDSLEDAERLLRYATQAGITVDYKVRESVLEARTATDKGLTVKQAKLLDAVTKLAAQMKPVTPESLRRCSAEPTLRGYWIVAIVLAIFIVPFSLASFVSSALSQSIKADIVTANELVVKLNSQLAPAAHTTSPTASTDANVRDFVIAQGVSHVDVGTELQSLASTTRGTYTRAQQLNWFIAHKIHLPCKNSPTSREKFRESLEVDIPVADDKLATTVKEYLPRYQDVRWFDQNVIDDVAVFYGAIASCLLPVLYALLGTCAYMLRSFSQAMSKRTFVPSQSDSAHFLIAGIGGAVVGLFNSFNITQSASISPLAVAFLVGYAVDVFFSFLEGMIQAFSRKGGTPEPKAV